MAGEHRSSPPLATTIAEGANAGEDAIALSLIVVGPGWVASHDLPARGDVTIGRDPATDIVIDDPTVSRKHASLSIGDVVTISDLGSRRGVGIGARRLASGERRELAIGESFTMGRVSAMIQASPDVAAGDGRGGLLGAVERKIARLARGTISILVTGETGVGKERMAEMIHRLSPRSGGPLVKINCGAIAEPLLESELFGHEKGAFTGATAAKPGLLEAANSGTVFLDEIGEMPAGVQVKLLRALESRQVRRVGSVEARDYDARFVAATNRDLKAEVAEGRFREDLFYRLAGAIVRVPPLRDRRAEILPLTRAFLEQQSASLGEPPPTLSPDAIDWLMGHSWPGNVRELRNTVERACLLADGGVVEAKHLTELVAIEPTGTSDRPTVPDPGGAVPGADGDEGPRKRIMEALARAGGNQKAAAEALGVSRRTLINWLDKYNIPRPRKTR